MIRQKTKNKDRAGCFGASDTQYIMGNWNTSTFFNWWQTKIGTRVNEFKNEYTLAGTYKEHQIADWYSKKHNVKLKLDRKIKLRRESVVVNLDSETKNEIIEIKTHKQTDKDWKVPNHYIWQVRVQMWASKKHNGKILAYAMTEEDYENFYMDIDESRIAEYPVEYNEQWIKNEYLPRKNYLANCMKQRKTPSIEEFKISLGERMNNQGYTISEKEKLIDIIKNQKHIYENDFIYINDYPVKVVFSAGYYSEIPTNDREIKAKILTVYSKDKKHIIQYNVDIENLFGTLLHSECFQPDYEDESIEYELANDDFTPIIDCFFKMARLKRK